MAATIGICLATFNGARFLQQQLDSIAGQSFDDWHLYVRDDCSSDATPNILRTFAQRHADRVTWVFDDAGRLGAKANFARLMARVREPYIAFSDQDDVWRLDKLSNAYAAMQRCEASKPSGTPVMVHADRRIIDPAGAEITASYWQSRGVRPAHLRSLEAHYTFCFAAGATMLINQPLRDHALPIPDTAWMYDTWIELVAHAFGEVHALDDIALDHRRHGHNTSGSQGDNNSKAARHVWARAKRLVGNLGRQQLIYAAFFAQAAAFRRQYGVHLSQKTTQRLDQFLALPQYRLPGRAISLWRSRAAPPGAARTLVFLALSGETPF